MELINYNESLAKHIRNLFIRVIVPDNFLLAVHKHNLDVLTDPDIARLRIKCKSNISQDVNMDLLDLLCHYNEWFDCVLKVLGDPEIKQYSYVPEFQKLKNEHDLFWNSKKSEKCEGSIVCQASDNNSLRSEPSENSSVQSQSAETAESQPDKNPALESQPIGISLQSQHDENSSLQSQPGTNSSLQYQPDENLSNLPVDNPSLQSEIDDNNPLQNQVAATDNCSVEMNEPLDGTVINNSLTTDSVDVMMGNLAITESQIWSMSGGRGRCYICDVELTSERLKDEHLSGRSHQKRLQRLSSASRSELIASQDLGNESMDETDSVTHCQTCDLPLTSPQHAEQHYSGKNHKKKVDALKINISDIPNNLEVVDNAIYKLDANGTGLCKVCNVSFTSRQNAKQHLDGKSHKKKL